MTTHSQTPARVPGECVLEAEVNFKWLTVPFSNATKEVKVAQTWEVRWQSRYGEYSSDVRPELESFLSEQEADVFAASLMAAFKLIRATSGNAVTVRKAN